MNQNESLTNTNRAILVVFSLLILHFSASCHDNSPLRLSAKFNIVDTKPTGFNFWLPTKQLITSIISVTERIHTLIEPELIAKSFKIVKITSKKITTRELWPVNGPISSAYGMRKHPVTHTRAFHNGIDIRAKKGTNIVTPNDGVVVSAGHAGLIGRLVKIQTKQGKTLYFGHMHRIRCKKGQTVKRGQVIGTVGSSGRTTGPHLHFSVRTSKGRYMNPLNYLSANKSIL